MGGGGPAKAADPKVTPFVEPAAPKNPIPNWFKQRPAPTPYQPMFGASQSMFGQPMAQPSQEADPNAIDPRVLQLLQQIMAIRGAPRNGGQ